MHTRRPFFIIAALLLSAGCTNNRLEQDLARLQDSVTDLRGFQAEQTTQIAAMDTQMRQMAGRIEELEYGQNKRLGSDLSSLKQDLQNLRKRVPPPPIVPAAILEEDEDLAKNMQPEIGKEFSEALSDVRAGNFDHANTLLNDLLTLTQGTPYTGNILFWQGIVREGSGDAKSAIEPYLALSTRYPKHRLVPAALLRQASIMIRLHDSKTAKLVLHKLIAEYPKSAEAASARQRLKDLPR